MQITQEMIDYLKDHIESRVHCVGSDGPTNQEVYAMDLAKQMYHCTIIFRERETPSVYVINEKQQASLVQNTENLALAVATACALSYGWVDPNV